MKTYGVTDNVLELRKSAPGRRICLRWPKQIQQIPSISLVIFPFVGVAIDMQSCALISSALALNRLDPVPGALSTNKTTPVLTPINYLAQIGCPMQDDLF
jgi:hypothetical protein